MRLTPIRLRDKWTPALLPKVLGNFDLNRDIVQTTVANDLSTLSAWGQGTNKAGTKALSRQSRLNPSVHVMHIGNSVTTDNVSMSVNFNSRNFYCFWLQRARKIASTNNPSTGIGSIFRLTGASPATMFQFVNIGATGGAYYELTGLGAQAVSNAVFSASTWDVMGYVVDPKGNVSYYENGRNIGLSTTVNLAAVAFTGFEVGQSTGSTMPGLEIAAMIFGAGVITTDHVNRITAYWQNKLGIPKPTMTLTIAGDSIMAGEGFVNTSTGNTANQPIEEVLALLEPRLRIGALTRSSYRQEEATVWMLSNGDTVLTSNGTIFALSGKSLHVPSFYKDGSYHLIEMGTNNIVLQDPSIALSKLRTSMAEMILNGQNVIPCRLIAKGFSSTLGDITNQITLNTALLNYNTQLSAKGIGWGAISICSWDSFMSDYTDTNKYQSDKIHPTIYGMRSMAKIVLRDNLQTYKRPVNYVTPASVQLSKDLFVDTNGTAISSHTMDDGINSPSNGGWTTNSGTWTIQSNSLQVSTTGYITTPVGWRNKTMSITAAPVVANATVDYGIVFDWIDANNYWYVHVNWLVGVGTSTLTIHSVVAGSDTTLSTTTISGEPSGLFTVAIVGTLVTVTHFGMTLTNNTRTKTNASMIYAGPYSGIALQTNFTAWLVTTP